MKKSLLFLCVVSMICLITSQSAMAKGHAGKKHYSHSVHGKQFKKTHRIRKNYRAVSRPKTYFVINEHATPFYQWMRYQKRCSRKHYQAKSGIRFIVSL